MGPHDAPDIVHYGGRLRIFSNKYGGSEVASVPMPHELFSKVGDVAYMQMLERDALQLMVGFKNGYWIKFYDFQGDRIPVPALMLISALDQGEEKPQRKWDTDYYVNLNITA